MPSLLPRAAGWLATAFLLFAALFPAPALAQRPALVKNTDEPGRTPFELWIEFYNGGCSFHCVKFYNGEQVMVFDSDYSVPANKRLVIQHIAGSLYALNPCSVSGCSVALQTQQILAPQSIKWFHPGPFYSTGTAFGSTASGFSESAFTTVEAGESLHFRLSSTSGFTNISSFVVVTGYLIDNTN